MNDSVHDSSTIGIEIAGVRAQLSSAFRPFMSYAAVHLAPLRNDSDAPRIRAQLHWHEQAPPPRLQAFPTISGMERIDRDLYRQGGTLVWLRVEDLRPLHLQFTWNGSELSIDAHFYFHLSANPTRERIKRLLNRGRLPALRQRRFTTLLYYLLYYPAFWWLERQRGIHPIHGAGVEFPEGVVILAGPSGVGKSTSSVALASEPDARFLSDTFLLCDAEAAYPVREPLLLDAWSRSWLGDAAQALQPIDWRYCLDRNGFHWPSERMSKGAPVRLIVFPHRGQRVAVQPVSAARAHGTLSAGDMIINDLRRYWAYSAVLEMLQPSPLMHARESALADLCGHVPAYDVTLNAGLSRADLIENVRGLLRSEAPFGRAIQAGR